MGGPFALRAEILGGLDDAGAEIHLPEAVHGDAGEQRIGGIDQPLGEAEPVVGNAGGSGGRTAGNARLDLLAGLVIGAANEQEGVAPLRAARPSPSRSGNCAPVLAFCCPRRRTCFQASRISPGAAFSRNKPAQLELFGGRALGHRLARDGVDGFARGQRGDLIALEACARRCALRRCCRGSADRGPQPPPMRRVR